MNEIDLGIYRSEEFELNKPTFNYLEYFVQDCGLNCLCASNENATSSLGLHLAVGDDGGSLHLLNIVNLLDDILNSDMKDKLKINTCSRAVYHSAQVTGMYIN